MPPKSADELRRAFLDFFVERGHTRVESASLIPTEPGAPMFTNAGMVPFIAYFVGDEKPPYPRATSVQKCVRVGGKHNDLDDIGRTNRHLSFFEMLGNFSFGDYFKADAIPWGWEFVTGVLGLDPDRLWVTVHESDDEAETIWRDVVGLPPERIQRMGDANFWRMADTGPCGPSSEIFWDLGPDAGPEGGPAVSEDRYVEIWNLVFMQFDAQPDGELTPLWKPCVDTGAGLERLLTVLEGVDTIWETSVFRPLISEAERVTGARYQHGRGGEADVSLRILADHARSMTFLVSDGVVPSNEDRGYVLRRIIRRAVRHAYRLGATEGVTQPMVDATIAAIGGAYPDLVAHRDLIVNVITREEERFRQTLERGVDLLDDLLAEGDVSGERAFFLHDTLGFPVDLTREIAEERGRHVDYDGFRARMEEQRTRAREALKAEGGKETAPVELYRELVDDFGETEFTGRHENETTDAKVTALIADGERFAQVGEGARVDVILDRTPFYAEAGGQVGDTGTLTTGDGRTELRVLDTQYGIPGALVVHRAEVVRGELAEGDSVTAAIDAERRDRIRRNHTATHILHWALREVLGPHVKQAGSLVARDRLRFDFSHFQAVTPEELERIEEVANREIITDAPVRHYETTREHAEAIGAIAFFGEKYGDLVRVLEAGDHSVELCGGTHVHALGFIGPIKIVGEQSIGANLRRIEALTGDAALDRIQDEERQLRRAAQTLKVSPGDLPDRIEQLQQQLKALRDEAEAARARDAVAEAAALAGEASEGVVAARRDGLDSGDLRRLAVATRDALDSGAVAIVGVGPDRSKAGIAVAVTKEHVERGVSAAEIAAKAAKALGGGTAKSADVVSGGGPNVDAVDEALALVRQQATEAVAGAPR
ncbi:MAG TPA: alanine--tRNA ligase [Acidimicrobiia bacterium]|nr:alanine--tRNA ligase [Acidimicrobiia bacterium]